MNNDDRISQEQLEVIEARLWSVVNRMTVLDIDLPPVSSMLGATLDCSRYAESLVKYAAASLNEETFAWQGRPLLQHLGLCQQCRNTLEQLQAVQRSAPKLRRRGQQPAHDIDLTLFDGEIPRLDPTLRSALDPRRPALLFSGFLDQPPGWYFVLETEAHADRSEPDLLLTLTPVAGSAANVSVTLVTFGQVLHGETDLDGRARFSHLLIPAADSLDTPVLSIQVRTSELSLA